MVAIVGADDLCSNPHSALSELYAQAVNQAAIGAVREELKEWTPARRSAGSVPE